MQAFRKDVPSVTISALWGALLSLGAPAGWLFYEIFVKQLSPAAALHASPDMYLYLTLSTGLVFTSLGLAYGKVMVRLASANHALIYANNALEHISRSDLVTGLPNAKSLHEVASLWVGRSRRGQEKLALLALGVNNLRDTSDKQSGKFAEGSLRTVAGLLAKDRRQEDFLARLGPREFAILLPDASSAEAEVLAQRIESNAAQTLGIDGGAVSLTIGITELGPLDDCRTLIGRAETALQQARRLKNIQRLTLAPIRATKK